MPLKASVSNFHHEPEPQINMSAIAALMENHPITGEPAKASQATLNPKDFMLATGPAQNLINFYLLHQILSNQANQDIKLGSVQNQTQKLFEAIGGLFKQAMGKLNLIINHLQELHPLKYVVIDLNKLARIKETHLSDNFGHELNRILEETKAKIEETKAIKLLPYSRGTLSKVNFDSDAQLIKAFNHNLINATVCNLSKSYKNLSLYIKIAKQLEIDEGLELEENVPDSRVILGVQEKDIIDFVKVAIESTLIKVDSSNTASNKVKSAINSKHGYFKNLYKEQASKFAEAIRTEAGLQEGYAKEISSTNGHGQLHDISSQLLQELIQNNKLNNDHAHPIYYSRLNPHNLAVLNNDLESLLEKVLEISCEKEEYDLNLAINSLTRLIKGVKAFDKPNGI